MQTKDLKPNPKNPRKISKERLAALKKSVDKFGDLSGFVFNQRSKTLVSGHQKTKTLPSDAKIVVDVRHAEPTRAGTVAEGHILVNGERFKYREVDWDQTTETEGMLAANKHSGEWDNDLLRIAIAEVKDIQVTGFSIPELKSLSIEMPKVKEQSDEEYVRDTPQTTEQIPTEAPGKTLDQIEEKKMDVVGKRFVIIIDCRDAKHKEELKEKLRSTVTESGANFF